MQDSEKDPDSPVNPDLDETSFDDEVMDDVEGFDEGGEYFDDEAGFDDAAFDDEGFDSEDWDEDGFDDGSNQKPKKAKKSIGFNAIVIVLGIMVGAVIIFLNFAKTPDGQDTGPKDLPFVSALVPTGQVNNPITAPAEQARKEREAAQQAAQQDQGFLQNADLLNQNEAEQEQTPPMPAPITGGTIETENPESPTALTPMPQDDITQADMQMAETNMQEPRMPDADPVAERPDMIESAVESVSDTVEETTNSAVDLLKEKLAEREGQDIATTVEAEQDSTDAFGADEAVPAQDVPMEEAQTMPEMEIAPVEDMAQDTAAMQNLQDELEQVRSELTAVQENKDETISELNNEIQNLRAELEQAKNDLAAAEKMTEKAVSKPAPKQTTSAPKRTAPKKAAVPKTKSWELRAAQPGKAWVSEKGGKEMRSVVVGDTLSGIGRVTAINYAGGVWTVQGTQGQIRQ